MIRFGHINIDINIGISMYIVIGQHIILREYDVGTKIKYNEKPDQPKIENH